MVQDGSTVSIEPLQETHLFRVQLLINMHLSTVAPGWGLPETVIAKCLSRNPYQETTDPWVRERVTLCALQKQRVVAAAHLLRYGDGPEVNPYYQNVGDLACSLAWPNAGEAAATLLVRCSSPVRCLGSHSRVCLGRWGTGPSICWCTVLST